MARYPAAKWVGSPNFTANGMADYRYFVLHIECGTEAGTISWFNNPKSQVSAHFSIGRDGKVYQHVDTKDKAWAEAAGNRHGVSCEFEGKLGDQLTDVQLEAAAHLLAWVHKTHGTLLQATDDPNSGKGVIGHGEGGDAWGGHPKCPGAVMKQRTALINRAKALCGAPAPRTAPQKPSPAPHLPSWYHRPLSLTQPYERGSDVAHMQGNVGVRSDGIFGPHTDAALKSWQKVHGLKSDGICGPKTAELMK